MQSVATGRQGRPRQPTDAERLLLTLELRGATGLHSHDIRKLGISGNPSARIAELEEQGYEIRHEREHVGRRPGVRYFLVAYDPYSEVA